MWQEKAYGTPCRLFATLQQLGMIQIPYTKTNLPDASEDSCPSYHPREMCSQILK